MEVMTVLAAGEVALVRVIGVVVLIGFLVSALMLIWADTQEEEKDNGE
jgi:hypothetical protein